MKHIVCLLFIGGMLLSCSGDQEEQNFNHFVEQFADIKVLRYEIPGFEELTLKEKKISILFNASRIGRKRYYMGSKLSS